MRSSRSVRRAGRAVRPERQAGRAGSRGRRKRPPTCQYGRSSSADPYQRQEWIVFILNCHRVSAVIGLCGLAYLAGAGKFSFISAALGQPAALTPPQSEALNAYNKTVQDFRAILRERRAQIDSKQKLPEKPGQALYLARVAMMGAYKDLTDVLPSKIGRPNKYKIPPAYFDADNEPLIDEYK